MCQMFLFFFDVNKKDIQLLQRLYRDFFQPFWT